MTGSVRLALPALLAACAPPPPPSMPGPQLAELLAETAPAGFERALVPRPFEFPADHGPHPAFRHEWWYLTGNLDAGDDARYGFELTFFRFALEPPGKAGAGRSAWHTDQVYAAHFAVADPEGRRFHVATRYARGALGLAGAQPEPLRVWVEDWSLEAPAGAAWRLRAAEPGFDLELELEPLKPIVLHGERGLSRKSSEPGNASYYYSIPRLAARGRLGLGGRERRVEGLAWFDREWGTSALDKHQTGWDWFALQLTEGSELTFYQLRGEHGGRHQASAGSWIAPDGSHLALESADVQIEALDHWQSPRGGRYPARWRLTIPQLALTLEIEPVLADQELPTWPRYWEGAVDVAGRRGSAILTGRGYVELTGYAD